MIHLEEVQRPAARGVPADGGRTRHDLSVCTVSFRNTRHLEINWAMARERTSGPKPIRWIVAENSPPGTESAFSSGGNPDWLTILPGIEGRYPPNLHHTLALNACVARVDTRFMLVLDPDFYILWEDWANTVIDHMLDSGLAIFGVPWHPKHGFKYRYFPCVHCVFIDLARVPVQTLDFRPARAQGDAPGSWLARSLLRHRRSHPTDSGTRFYQRYHNDPGIRSECAVPVYRLKEEFPEFGATLKSRLAHRLLPDHLCYLPKRKGAFTERGFVELGLGLPLAPDWEEFLWKERPFGFHVRRNARKSDRDEQREIEALDRVAQICAAGDKPAGAGRFP